MNERSKEQIAATRDAFLKGFDSGWDAADGANMEIGKGDWLELRLAAWESFKAEKGIQFA